jgi:hypothetical protein
VRADPSTLTPAHVELIKMLAARAVQDFLAEADSGLVGTELHHEAHTNVESRR